MLNVYTVIFTNMIATVAFYYHRQNIWQQSNSKLTLYTFKVHVSQKRKNIENKFLSENTYYTNLNGVWIIFNINETKPFYFTFFK